MKNTWKLIISSLAGCVLSVTLYCLFAAFADDGRANVGSLCIIGGCVSAVGLCTLLEVKDLEYQDKANLIGRRRTLIKNPFEGVCIIIAGCAMIVTSLML